MRAEAFDAPALRYLQTSLEAARVRRMGAEAFPGIKPGVATAQALADLPVEVILTTGQNRDPGSLGLDRLPSNVHIERWLSHETLLPKCAAVVTTGGPATVMAALKAAVPLVMVPTFWEKSDNAQRVVEAGVGLRLAPRRCTPDRVREAVMRLLDEPHFRDNARRISDKLARAPGPGRAAELIEGLVERMPAQATVA